MNYNYDLAVRLKKAGFPQLGDGFALIVTEDMEDPDGPMSVLPWNNYVYDAPKYNQRGIYAPTLSELITACMEKSNDFRLVLSPGIGWRVNGYKGTPIQKYGATPEIAVANLWLALNTKTT